MLLTAAVFRPPSVPLITSDPYLSVWSDSSKLTDTNTVHWSGTQQSLVSLIRIDGVSYRLMGDDPASLAAFPQISVQVLPTRSIYNFDNGHVHVTMTFMQPALPTDLNAISLPLSYITWDVHSVDGRSHAVQVYDSTSSQLAVNTTSQVVAWQRGSTDGMTTLRAGTTAQTYFTPAGDQVRIDWGYVYAAADSTQSSSSIGYDTHEINTFTAKGALTNTDDNAAVPRAVSNNQPVLAFAFNFGTVGTAIVERHVIVAYNEVYSVNYFGEYLTPYWARNGTTVEQMLGQAQDNYSSYVSKCTAFDNSLMNDLTSEGGSQYAKITALAYRQTFAGMGLAADPNGQPLLFPKENTSNGDIATVDVLFPLMPQLLLFSPTLAKAALEPILDFSSSSLWTNSYAPHDLGTYPNALGQGTGSDGNETMPVETSADMIIMIDAIAKEEGSSEFADRYWSLITTWANYLKPLAATSGSQLTTNDFLGNINDSTNLSVKSIVALGAYAQLCTLHGDATDAATFTSAAQSDVTYWLSHANGGTAAGGYTQYLFSEDMSNIGVQLYNLVMDQVLGTSLFPSSVAASDISYAESVLTSQPSQNRRNRRRPYQLGVRQRHDNQLPQLRRVVGVGSVHGDEQQRFPDTHRADLQLSEWNRRTPARERRALRQSVADQHHQQHRRRPPRDRRRVHQDADRPLDGRQIRQPGPEHARHVRRFSRYHDHHAVGERIGTVLEIHHGHAHRRLDEFRIR